MDRPSLSRGRLSELVDFIFAEEGKVDRKHLDGHGLRWLRSARSLTIIYTQASMVQILPGVSPGIKTGFAHILKQIKWDYLE